MLRFFKTLAERFDTKADLKRKHAAAMRDLEERWRKRYAHDNAKTEKQRELSAEVVRRVIRISLEPRDQRTGNFAVRVVVPASELLHARDANEFIESLARQLGYMVEKEFRALRGIKLATMLNEAEDRECSRPRSHFSPGRPYAY